MASRKVFIVWKRRVVVLRCVVEREETSRHLTDLPS